MSYDYHFTDDETKVQWSSYLPKVSLPGGRAGFQIQLFNTKIYALCTDSSFSAIDLWHKGQVTCPLYASVSPYLLGKIRLCDHRAHCNSIILRFYASPPALFQVLPVGTLFSCQLFDCGFLSTKYTPLLVYSSLCLATNSHSSRSYWFVKTQQSLEEPWWLLSNSIHCL